MAETSFETLIIGEVYITKTCHILGIFYPYSRLRGIQCNDEFNSNALYMQGQTTNGTDQSMIEVIRLEAGGLK